MEKRRAAALLYQGFALLDGTVTGMLAFSANRYRASELILLVLGGALVGLGTAAVIHAVSELFRK